MPGADGNHSLLPAENQGSGPPRQVGYQCAPAIGAKNILAAKAAAHLRFDNPQLSAVNAETSGHILLHGVRRLCGGQNGQISAVIIVAVAAVGFQLGVDLLGCIDPDTGHMIAPGQHGIGISIFPHTPVYLVPLRPIILRQVGLDIHLIQVVAMHQNIAFQCMGKVHQRFSGLPLDLHQVSGTLGSLLCFCCHQRHHISLIPAHPVQHIALKGGVIPAEVGNDVRILPSKQADKAGNLFCDVGIKRFNLCKGIGAVDRLYDQCTRPDLVCHVYRPPQAQSLALDPWDPFCNKLKVTHASLPIPEVFGGKAFFISKEPS